MGAKPGEIYGNKDIELWTPLKALQSSNLSVNHFFGVAKDDLYLVLMNTSNKVQTADIILNQDKIPFDSDTKYSTLLYDSEGKNTKGQDMINGVIDTKIPAQSVVVVKIQELNIEIPISPTTEKRTVFRWGTQFFKSQYAARFIGNNHGDVNQLC